MKRCYDRIDEIYAANRLPLTMEERLIFNLPSTLRKKKGLEAMSTWIAMAELTITNAYKRNGMKYGRCMFSNNCIRRKNKSRKMSDKDKKPPRNKKGK